MTDEKCTNCLGDFSAPCCEMPRPASHHVPAPPLTADVQEAPDDGDSEYTSREGVILREFARVLNANGWDSVMNEPDWVMAERAFNAVRGVAAVSGEAEAQHVKDMGFAEKHISEVYARLSTAEARIAALEALVREAQTLVPWVIDPERTGNIWHNKASALLTTTDAPRDEEK